MRRALEARVGLSALRLSTGCREIIGPGVAGECEARDGPARQRGSFPPRDRRSRDRRAAAPTGDEGELVLTTLTKEALPMHPLPHRRHHRARRPRRAGAGGRRCAWRGSRGARDDMLVIKGVNVYPSQVEAALLAVADLAPHYQLVVDRTQAFPPLDVHVEPAERAGARVGRLRRDASGGGARCRRGSPSGCAATLRPEPGDRDRGARRPFPRSEGKAVRVIERRAQTSTRERSKETTMTKTELCWPGSSAASASSRPTR